MTLKDWEQRNKWLVGHSPTKPEIQDMFSVGERDLRDSEVGGLSADAGMNNAYSGGHVNYVVADTKKWEQSAAYVLDAAILNKEREQTGDRRR